MKNLLVILFFLSSIGLIAQPLNRSFESASGSFNLLGQVTLERLQEEPFAEWYRENYDAHEVQAEFVPEQLPDSITIFMGTWCGDSQREVPRFMKILESQYYDLSKLKIICLNTGFQNYKQAPEREERGVNIHRVPTFIMHTATGEEVGRIVEEPVVSLEEDMQTILDGKPYATAYPVVADLLQKFEQYSLKELRKMKKKLIEEYGGKAKSESELNTYGYVLWASFDLQKAAFIFELNTELFPESARPFQSLAMLKRNLGQEKEALRLANRGLSIAPDNERLLRLKEELGG